MSAVALDADRLAQLRVFTEAEVRQIMADVIDAVTAQLEHLHSALPSRDFKSAADAAHRGRNETLLIGARELCDAFTSLEQAARAGDATRAEGAAKIARELWPATQTAITRVLAGGHASIDATR
jgi:HPt (histidine-containing phosphotransfer) domain-containing protein